MSIAFQCKCGRAYNLADASAGRTIHCLNYRQPMTVPARTAPQPPPAASTAAVQVEPTVPQHSEVSATSPSGAEQDLVARANLLLRQLRGEAAEPSGHPGEALSVKRGFSRADLVLVGGGILMAAAFFWYFIGYRLFGGERLYPTGALIVSGLFFMLKHIARDMQD